MTYNGLLLFVFSGSISRSSFFVVKSPFTTIHGILDPIQRTD